MHLGNVLNTEWKFMPHRMMVDDSSKSLYCSNTSCEWLNGITYSRNGTHFWEYAASIIIYIFVKSLHDAHQLGTHPSASIYPVQLFTEGKAHWMLTTTCIPLSIECIATALSHTRDRILEVFKERQGFTTQLLRTHAMSWLLSTMASAWHGMVL